MALQSAQITPLVDLFDAHASGENAAPMKRYMRDRFEFLGIKTPERRALLREYLVDHRQYASNHLRPMVRRLWELPHREYQYAGVDLLERFGRKLTANDLKLLECLITHRPWWDTVDGLAARIVGPLLRRFPESRNGVITKWRHTENLWLRRTTIIFQLKYRADTDAELLFSIIRDNKSSTEFFLQKAIGWALREYSKTEPRAVRQFVKSEDLSPLSMREALKWLQSHSE